MKAKVIALCNQKGGVGKTTTTLQLGAGLVLSGKKVLLIDADPQGSLTSCLGWKNNDALEITLSDLIGKVIEDRPFEPTEGILRNAEGIDLMPSNLELSSMEMTLFNTMSRESALKTYLSSLKGNYDYILIDCMPSLGMLTVNALTAADSVIIPVQAQYLSAKGMTQLFQHITKVKRIINPKLQIDGVLMTMVNQRANHSKDIIAALKTEYGDNIKIFDTCIPHSIKAAEASAAGKSLFAYDKQCSVAKAYAGFTKEVINDAERTKNGLWTPKL